MKKLIFIIMLLVLSSFVYAHEDHNIDYNKYLNDLSYSKEQANNNINHLPSVGKKLLNNNRILVHITMNNGEKKDIYGVFSKNKLITLEYGTITDVDLEVSLSEKDIQDVINSHNPRATIKSKLNKSINYKVYGTFNKVKVKFLLNFL